MPLLLSNVGREDMQQSNANPRAAACPRMQCLCCWWDGCFVLLAAPGSNTYILKTPIHHAFKTNTEAACVSLTHTYCILYVLVPPPPTHGSTMRAQQRRSGRDLMCMCDGTRSNRRLWNQQDFGSRSTVIFSSTPSSRFTRQN